MLKFQKTCRLSAVSRSFQSIQCFSSSKPLHKNNVFLMGSPGSGKTSVGRLLAPRLGKPVIDVDNDHLEKYWQMPVADKLTEVGSEQFIEAEGEATLALDVSDSVVSMTGSNPMHKEAMKHISSLGTTIFLDVQNKDILERLERMKVGRIVGQGHSSMESILQYRQQFYEGNYDVRVIVEPDESLESITEKVEKAFRAHQQKAGNVSTRGAHVDENRKPSFSDVVLKGLAPDRGLYVPDISAFPQLTLKQLQRMVNMTYAERALRILEQWIHPNDLHPSLIQKMVTEAYSAKNFNHPDIIPVVKLESDIFLTELFHGPTASFKDAALQLMPNFFQHALHSSGSQDRYLILVATSGDTGGAVLDGFGKLADTSDIKVMVMYPEEGISDIQKAQMTASAGSNVSVVGIKADFDFCQSSIKTIFSDKAITGELYEKHGVILSAANSLNWGRLIPQVIYHVSSYLDLVKAGTISMGEKVDLCVPTGNFGNILAAFYAKKMGVPYKNTICASNMNNVLTDFISTGAYDLRSRKLHLTSSPAIDILKSSNLERFLYHISHGNFNMVDQLFKDLDQNGYFKVTSEVHRALKGQLLADWCDEEHCFRNIKETYRNTGYILDPHTSVAHTVAKRFQSSDRPMIISSTAHYGKFAHDVHNAVCGSSVQSNLRLLFEQLGQMAKQPLPHFKLISAVLQPRRHKVVCEASIDAVIEEIGKALKPTPV